MVVAMSTPSFRRQVVVRIPAEDWSLLEDAAREHGSQQAAVLAGLRELRRQRETPTTAKPAPRPAPPRSKEPPTDPPAPPTTPPGDADPDSDAWWTGFDEAGVILGLEGAPLRRRIQESGAATRQTGSASEVRADQLHIDTSHAAELLEVTPDTLRSRAQRGEMGAVERGGRYFFPIGELELGLGPAAKRLGISPDQARARVDRGELTHHRDAQGRRRVRLLDTL